MMIEARSAIYGSFLLIEKIIWKYQQSEIHHVANTHILIFQAGTAHLHTIV